jgi:hypothetical protein
VDIVLYLVSKSYQIANGDKESLLTNEQRASKQEIGEKNYKFDEMIAIRHAAI